MKETWTKVPYFFFCFENMSFTYKCRVPDVDHVCFTASESLGNIKIFGWLRIISNLKKKKKKQIQNTPGRLPAGDPVALKLLRPLMDVILVVESEW